MAKPRFFTLTVWEPSLGGADAHVHDKVEFFTILFLKIRMMNKSEREKQTLIERRRIRSINPQVR